MVKWEDSIWSGVSEGYVLTKIHNMELYLLKFKIEIVLMNIENEIGVNVYDCDGFDTDPILNEKLSFSDEYIYKQAILVDGVRDENHRRLLLLGKNIITISERKKKIANLLKL